MRKPVDCLPWLSWRRRQMRLHLACNWR